MEQHNFSGYCLIEQLYSGTKTLVYRAIREIDQQSVVIKILKNEHPSFNELVQFRNEYAIAKNLNISGIIQPYSLEPYCNSYALVMENFVGISLREWIKQRNQEVGADFFPIALQLVDTLHLLHQQRVIHKDIKPSNILIDPQSLQVKLIDFSISTLLPKETQEIQSLELPEGTLAYLSPEQTGRMNRGIDYRSDFYSLGVTFYELLTGQLPFQSTEPLEVIYCHLAQQPIPPHQVAGAESRIPEALSQIVIKLMAKNAEDRYQSALGLKYDLEKCFTHYQQAGTVAPFALGERDVCDRFVIPEKLYGREQEVAALLAAFVRVACPEDKRVAGTGKQESSSRPNLERPSSHPQSELMLVAGFSGIGKTAIVNEVHKPIVRQRGYFIAGKFDQFQRNIPFSALVQAFRHLMAQLLSESDAQLAQWKTRILSALGENAQVIIDVVPELERIIGCQPAVPELTSSAAQNRFNLLFQKFIRVFAAPEHPLVLFIDDLQWADSASLNLIKLLLSEAETGYLLILGAYRDNEVFAAHPLMLTLTEISRAGATLNTITLAPLSADDINQLVADTLSCPPELASPLTELVYQKTQGNPFFTAQFLKTLHEEGCIAFDPRVGHWQCDIAAAKALALTDDVVEFMALQLQKLPVAAQNGLQLAACIGDRFDLDALSVVSELSTAQVALNLWQAIQEGFILPVDEVYKFYQGDSSAVSSQHPAQPALDTPLCSYRFLHDRVQQAAYSLIPEAQRPAIHLKIGQLLLSHSANIEQDNNLFDIVNHLNQGAELIVQPTEREQIVRLNRLAAKKARAATAYEAAMTYATQGIALLAPDCWQSQYELTLELHELATESAFLARDLKQMEQWAEIALQQAKSPLDQIKIYEIKLQTCVSEHRPLDAIALGKQALNQFGIQLPDQPTQAEIQQAFQYTVNQFAGRTTEELINLPPMTAAEPLAAMRITASMAPAVYFAAPSLYPLLILSQVNASIQYGNAPLSAFFYASYGLLLNGILEDMAAAARAGEVALGVLGTLNAREVESKTRFILGTLVVHGTAHLQTSLQFLRQSYQIGVETGDIEFAGHAAFNSCQYAYFSGQELETLERDIHVYSQRLMQLKQVMALNYCQLFRQITLNLLGASNDPRLLVGEDYDEAQMLPQLLTVNDQMGLHFFYVHKLILGYLSGDSAQSLSYLASQVRQYLAAGTGYITVPIFYFYDSLVALAGNGNSDGDTETEDSNRLQRVAENQAKLQKWADHAPMNHLHKWHLVEAETHRVLGNKAEAMDHYDRAIAIARANQYIQETALANELAAKFYLEWGKERIAQEYMTEAYYDYVRWGAKAKVDALAQHYPQLLAPILQQPQSRLTTTSTRSASSHSSPAASSSVMAALDLATVLKVSQTLSGSIEFAQLLTTLLQVMVENAGAEKCVLMLLAGKTPEQSHNQEFHNQDLLIQGLIHAGTAPIVLQHLPIEASQDIPLKLIYTVKHSLHSVVLINAAADPDLATDPYIGQQQPKSVLCSPILHRGNFAGVLYLENNLATGVFTHNRVELLNLLCAQAAISLENARLYQQSQAYAQQLEVSLDALQASEKRFNNLAANVPGMIYQFCLAADGSHSTPYVSSGCWDLYELDAKEVMAGRHDLYTMHHPDDYLAIEQAIQHSAATLTAFNQEWRIITPSGKVKWIQSAARPERKADGSIVWDGVVVDISERKRIEAKLHEALQAAEYQSSLLRSVLDSTSDWIFAKDQTFRYIVVNRSMAEAIGQSIEDILGKTDLELGFPEELVFGNSEKGIRGFRTDDQSVLAGEAIHNSYDPASNADGSLQIFDTRKIPMRDAAGKIFAVLGLSRNVTDRYHAEAALRRSEAQLKEKAEQLEHTLQELQQTQTQMVQSEKMSSLGQLVAGVAHEINNPVNFIYGNLNHAAAYTQDLLELLHLYQHHYPTPHSDIQQKVEDIDLDFLIEDLPKLLSSMKVGADRIQKIVASLRTFSRMDEAEMKVVNIHEGINSTLMILEHRLKAKPGHPSIEVIKHYGDLPLVECYAGQLNQVFMNILSNAIDALEEQSELKKSEAFAQHTAKLQTSNPAFSQLSTVTPRTITIRTQLVHTNQVEICIADNGPGIPEAALRRLFDPFFTTKPVGKGTGMGLSISYQIVTEKHKGSLTCNSKPGNGAEFIIQIPLKQPLKQ